MTLGGTLVHEMLSITGKEQRSQVKLTPEENAAQIEQKAQRMMEIEMAIQSSEEKKDE